MVCAVKRSCVILPVLQHHKHLIGGIELSEIVTPALIVKTQHIGIEPYLAPAES